MWNLIVAVVYKVTAEVVFKIIRAIYEHTKAQKKSDVDASDK